MKSAYKIFILSIPFLLSIFACAIDDDIIQTEEEICISCFDGVTGLDTIFLDAETLAFIPYTGDETIFFKNAIGDEVKFEPLFLPTHSFRMFDFEVDCDGVSQNFYEYTRDQYSVSHKCEALNLQYFLNVYTENSRNYPRFIDVFRMNFHEPTTDNIIDTVINLSIIPSYKGNQDLLSEEFLFYNNYEFASEFQLLDKTFSDVYTVIESEDNLLTTLHFNVENGIVGFKDLTQELWVFDRIE